MLTDQQRDELDDLIKRRDRQLRFFWQRERDLRAELDKISSDEHPFQVEIRRLKEREECLESRLNEIADSPSVRLGRALTWPLRAARNLFRR